MELETGLVKRAKDKIKEEDRRVRRSRKMLKAGLMELMKKKSFAEISVKDVTDLMDMNRGTFYLHYSGTSDLLRSIEDDMEEEIQQIISSKIGELGKDQTMIPFFLPILDYIIEHREICECFYYNNDASGFLDRLQKICYKNGADIIRVKFPNIPADKEKYLLSYLTFGLTGFIKTWFEEGMKMDKKELLDMGEQLIFSAASLMEK